MVPWQKWCWESCSAAWHIMPTSPAQHSLVWSGDAGASARRWPELPTGTGSLHTIPRTMLLMGSLCLWHEFVKSQSSCSGSVPACLSPLVTICSTDGQRFLPDFSPLPVQGRAPRTNSKTGLATPQTRLHSTSPNSSIICIPAQQVRTSTPQLQWQSQDLCQQQRCQPQSSLRKLGTGTDARLHGSPGAWQFPEKFRCHPAPSQQAAAFPGRELYF